MYRVWITNQAKSYFCPLILRVIVPAFSTHAFNLMPAIQPARLKHQTAYLASVFEQPEEFRKALSNLLNYYSDHTHRPGQGGVHSTLIESYQVPGQVIREIIFELKPIIQAKPQVTLQLSQFIWQEPVLEYHLIASALIGQISPFPPDQVIHTIQAWLEAKPEDQIMRALINQGMLRLRREQTTTYLEVAQEWFSRSSVEYRRYGLWAFYYLAIDPDYRNLPEVFHLLTPLLRSTPNELRPDILNITQNLAHYAPQETAYLLKQNINRSDAPDIAWLTRNLIPEFPQSIQANLREALRSI